MGFSKVKLALIIVTIIGLSVARQSWKNEYSNGIAQETELVENNSSNLEEESKTEEFKVVGEFYEGLARIERDKKYGFVNESGDIAIAPIYDEAGNFSEGLVAVVLEGKSFFINAAGETIITLEDYHVYSNFRESCLDPGSGCINIGYPYEMSQFNNGVASVSKIKPLDLYDGSFAFPKRNISREYSCASIDRNGTVIGNERTCTITESER